MVRRDMGRSRMKVIAYIVLIVVVIIVYAEGFATPLSEFLLDIDGIAVTAGELNTS